MSWFELNNGEKLYYEDSGSGNDTLVMMHGWTSSHEIFSKPAKQLSRVARCVIYDHRGHGESKQVNHETVTMETLADDLDELIAGLGLEDVTLVGWSMGAAVALTYIRDHGSGVLKRVILCDMTPKMLNDDGWRLGLYCGSYTVKDKDAAACRDFLSVYRDFVRRAIPRLARIPCFLLDHGLKKELEKCNESVLKSLSTSITDQDNRDIVRRIDVPLAYFYADPGSLFSPELKDWFRDNTQTEFREVGFSGCTHMLIAEKPELFAKEIEKILD